jgi:diacylglycerol kinase (ATP)
MRIILNPMARHGAGRRIRHAIERELDRRRVHYDLVQTEGPGHARDLARDAARDGIRRIVAAGGDGTVHDVANGILAAAVNGASLGVLPIGTGNDFAKMVPGTATRPGALDALAAGRTIQVDVGRASWDDRVEYFTNAMGTGIDVEVVRQLRRSRYVPGGASYVTALVRALLRYRPMAVAMEIDGRTVLRRIMNLAVCNGTSIGGTFRICPDARADDGLLDVCVVDEMPVLRNALMVPRVLTGTHTRRHGVTMDRGAAVHLTLAGGGPLPFQLDGELREAADGGAGIRIDLLPLRLNVISGGSPGGAAAQDG